MASDGERRRLSSGATDPGRTARAQSVYRRIRSIARGSREAVSCSPAESRYRQILDEQTEMICRFTKDMVVTYANHAYAVQYDLDPQSIIGHSLLEFFPEEAHDWARDQVARLGPDLPVDRHENEVVFADGGRAWFSWTDTVAFDEEGNVVEIQAVGRDVTESHAMEEALRRSETWFRHAFDDAPIGMAILDDAGRVSRANQALCDFTGVADSQELVGRSLADLVIPEDVGIITTGKDRLREEVRFRQAPTGSRWAQLSLSRFAADDQGQVGRLLQVVDLDDRKRVEEQLAHDALHDPLTGLPNRSLLLDRLGHALSRRGVGSEIAVLFGDLDQFKLVNDSLGHEVGDLLLGIVASRLAAAVREHDTLARFGGDEFVVLAEGLVSRSEAFEVANRLMASLAEPIDLGVTEVAVGISIGIAMAADLRTPSEVIRAADAAMYLAKEGARPRIAYYDQSLESAAAARLSLQTDLDRALDRREFVVCYQPIIAADGQAVAAEALVRWDRGLHGVWTPASFLGVAEDTGLIVQLGRHILGRACRQAAHWSRCSGRPIQAWVNVCGRELIHPGYPAAVERALAASGLEPDQLCIELTEWTVLSDLGAVAEAAADLKRLGVRLALDDFGTGYSALDFLRRFPLDAVKVDRSFILGVTDAHGTDRALVNAIAHLGAALGLTVVGEGVENAEQVALLRSLGVPLLQGYELAHPAVPEALAHWFDRPASPRLAS